MHGHFQKIFMPILSISTAMICSCKNLDTLVFSGGGLRGGPLIAGSLWRLSKRLKNFDVVGYSRNIKEIRGTSIGSMAAIYIACRVDPDEFVADMMKINYYPLVEWSGVNLLNNYGLNDGQKIIEYFNEFIYSKTNIKEANFKELCEWAKLKLVIIASDINDDGKEIILSDTTTPNMSVAEAMAASMSIPVFFSPRKFNSHLLVDGGLVNNYPISGVAGLCNPETTLGFLCRPGDSQELKKKKNWFDYFHKLISVILRNLDKGQFHHREKINTLKLRTKSRSDAMTWSFTYEERQELLSAGIKSADDFLNQGFLIDAYPKIESSTQT
tara:strand:- start:8544 stop:9524 length:981 start_codon:yes stop_codon:yes gene_type:complete